MGIIRRPLSDRMRATALLVCASAYIFGAYAFIGYAPSWRNTAPTGPVVAGRVDLSKLCGYGDGDPITKCKQPANPKVTFWGDSMSLAWSEGLPGSAVYNFPGCAPVIGREGKKGCREFNTEAVKHLQGDTLYIAGRWSVYGPLDITPSLEAVRRYKRVVVIGPSPNMQASAAKCLKGTVKCGLTRAQFDAEAKPILARLRKQAKPFPNVEVLDVSDEFCAADCPVKLDGVVLYADMNHPSAAQAKRVLSR